LAAPFAPAKPEERNMPQRSDSTTGRREPLPRGTGPADCAPRRGGFTLVEVLIVVVVMGILASLVIPAFRSTHTVSLESAARILASDIRLARSQAVQFNMDFNVQFNFAGNSYTVIHPGAGSPPALKNPLAPVGQEFGTYTVDFDQFSPPGATTPHVKLAGAALKTTQQNVNDVSFNLLGGTGPFRSQDTIIWLTAGSGADRRAVRITVSWVTGAVYVDPPRMLPPGTESQLFN